MNPLLPIFPLQVVLMPTNPLPLHIFEPRYQEMIGECMAGQQPFGVIRAKEEALAEAGCTAQVVDVIKRYDDGRLDILTQGLRRFEILHVNEERSFLRAEVSYFDDDGTEGSPQQRQRALELQNELIALAGNPALHSKQSEKPLLSFRLAGEVPLDLDFKQTLLEMRSEAERLTSLITYYEALIPKLRRLIKARIKSGGNGHAL